MSNDSCSITPTPDSNSEKEKIRKILQYKTLAIVGCSPKPERPSYQVSAYLKEHGYKIVPVNPGFKEILGEPCYPNLAAIPYAVDVVVVFRRSEEVLPIAQEAVSIHAKALWMQDGIENLDAARTAQAAGLDVVMNHCFARAHALISE